MKYVKKIFALLLCIMLVASLGVMAFADGDDTGTTQTTPTGSIILHNCEEGQTYKIYRILDVTYDQDTGSIAYELNDDWRDFFEQDTINGVYIDIVNNNVTWKDNADAAVFAQKAYEWAEEQELLDAYDMFTCNPTDAGWTAEANGNGYEKTLTNVPLGYYMVHSSMGSLLSLDTTAMTAEIYMKNKKPTTEKQVLEDRDGSWGKVNDARIGQEVDFRTVVTVQKGNSNYILHDTMSKGLTFLDDKAFKQTLSDGSEVTRGIGVCVMIGSGGEATTNIEYVDQSKYTLYTGNKAHPGCTFDVVFHEDFVDTLQDGEKLYVMYTGEINENAVVGEVNNPGPGNENESFLSYGEDNRTESSVTKTYTWKIPIYKFTKDANENKIPLEGAEFVLYYIDKNKDKQYAMINERGTIFGLTDDKNMATTLISNEVGLIKISGLDELNVGYYLEEVKAPDGYNLLKEPVKFNVNSVLTEVDDAQGLTIELTQNGGNDVVSQVGVENKKGVELPSTGGIGTRIFYIVGALLVVVAVVLLVTKSRMGKREK